MQQEMNIDIRWRAFPLHPDTPEQGLSIEDLFKQKGMLLDTGKMMAQLKATATDLGLEFGSRTMTYNSRLAQEVGLWAETKGRGHQFHMAAFKAYFADGKNLAKKEVVMDLIKQSGLDTNQGEVVIKNRTFSEAVDSDWELSRQSGIVAVPTFVSGFERLVGAQPYEALKKLVTR